MYQARVSNIVIPSEAIVAPDVDEAMWQLFVAVGDFWKLDDDPEPYPLCLRAFMASRRAGRGVGCVVSLATRRKSRAGQCIDRLLRRS
jgi:hypothetical protein